MKSSTERGTDGSATRSRRSRAPNLRGTPCRRPSRALRRRHTFRGEGSLEAWVWKIAIRTAQEQRSKPRAVSLNGSVEPALAEPERDPALAEALRALPARRRLIVFLRYFADLSYGEIADVCGVSEGTVGAALAQARTALEKSLADEEGGRGRA